MVKALLKLMSIEYPKSHDVSDALLEHRDKLPVELRGRVEDLAKLVSELASIRESTFSTDMRGRKYLQAKLSA